MRGSEVRVVDLSMLRIGDIILETGDRSVAAATGGVYGHASILLGRLVRLEAGIDDGVTINTFELQRFSRLQESFVGFALEADNNIIVRRRKNCIDEGSLLGEALWEAGRAYSMAKLADLPDLTDKGRRILGRYIRGSGYSNPEDRFCSEVVANILRLESSNISPNGLASHDLLYNFDSAIRDLNEDWQSALVCDAQIKDFLARFSLGHAERALQCGNVLADRLREVPTEEREALIAQIAEQLDHAITGDIRNALEAINKVTALEAEVFSSIST